MYAGGDCPICGQYCDGYQGCGDNLGDVFLDCPKCGEIRIFAKDSKANPKYNQVWEKIGDRE